MLYNYSIRNLIGGVEDDIYSSNNLLSSLRYKKINERRIDILVNPSLFFDCNRLICSAESDIDI
jgi:hypothetical protein